MKFAFSFIFVCLLLFLTGDMSILITTMDWKYTHRNGSPWESVEEYGLHYGISWYGCFCKSTSLLIPSVMLEHALCVSLYTYICVCLKYATRQSKYWVYEIYKMSWKIVDSNKKVSVTGTYICWNENLFIHVSWMGGMQSPCHQLLIVTLRRLAPFQLL